MKLIVGLGNPGKEYEMTRHNIGFMVIDSFLGEVKWQKKFNALYYEDVINGEKVIFVKPQTYMNNSGMAVVEFVKYFDIPLDNILVIQDDLDLVAGTYRLKAQSSDGGHNGIKSIISHLNSNYIPRLKIGIKTEYCNDVIDYVLGKLSKKELDLFKNNEDNFKEIILSFISDGIDKTMNIYNSRG